MLHFGHLIKLMKKIHIQKEAQMLSFDGDDTVCRKGGIPLLTMNEKRHYALLLLYKSYLHRWGQIGVFSSSGV